jgi:hypothetical protein
MPNQTLENSLKISSCYGGLISKVFKKLAKRYLTYGNINSTLWQKVSLFDRSRGYVEKDDRNKMLPFGQENDASKPKTF